LVAVDSGFAERHFGEGGESSVELVVGLPADLADLGVEGRIKAQRPPRHASRTIDCTGIV
jgi:hypothetical protein